MDETSSRRNSASSSRLLRRIMLLLLLSLAPVLASAPSAAALDSLTTVPPTQSLRSACDLASTLTGKSRPADALALIQKIRGEVPPQAATVSSACESERLAALIKAQDLADAAASNSNAAQNVGSDWDKFISGWVAPLAEAGLVLLGLLAFFLLLARLFVFIPTMPWGMYGVAERRRKLLMGGLLIAIGSLGIVFVASRLANGLALGFGMLAGVASVVVGVVGALLLAIYLSSRLRVSLEVRSSDESGSKADAARIGGYLYELGSTPPRGVEIPEGSDASALSDGVLTVGFTNKVLAAIQKLVVSVVGVTPWRIVISFSKEHSPTVAITRNGWSVAATNIDRGALGLTGDQTEDDSSGANGATAVSESGKLAAAFIIVTLASKHHGFEGLCGATDWRSLGLHFIATTDTQLHDGRDKVLLGKSIDLDPKNLLAEVAFQNRMFRQSVDPATSEKYAFWLKRKAIEIARDIEKGSKSALGYTFLLYRIRMTYLSVVLNLPRTADYDAMRLHAAGVAAGLLNDLKPNGLMPEPLAHSMRLRAVLAYHDLCGPTAWAAAKAPSDGVVSPLDTWHKEALDSIAPSTAYDAACSIARNGGEANEPEIRDRLSYAFTDPTLKAWARIDPELRDLRADKDFLQFLSIRPRQDFWELQVFAAYKNLLRAAGVSSPGQLPYAPVATPDIRLYLNVSPLVFARLVRLARMVHRADDLTYEGSSWRIYPFRVEVVDALIQEGIETPEKIHDLWIAESTPEDAGPHNPSGFIAQLRKRIESNTLIAPEPGPLKTWLRQLKATPAATPSDVPTS